MFPLFFLLTFGALAACGPRYPGTGEADTSGSSTQRAGRTLANEIEAELLTKRDVWYPRVIDREHGGYLTEFTDDWLGALDQLRD